MFNDIPAQNIKTNGHITKYVKIHNVIKYSVKSCTL